VKASSIRRLLAVALGGIAAGVVALAAAIACEPLPAPLASAPAASLTIVDRGGRLIHEVRTDGERASGRVALEDVSPWVVPALLAAEDKRFFSHPGVDALAVTRAAFQLVRARRVVSGASTLTQQLARNVAPHPRTALGKLGEMVTALRIERELDKRRILEEYLGRVEFGPNVRGIEAASRRYFDKPARALDLGEAATLAAIPRGPTLYDPERGRERLERRRRRVLDRLADMGTVAPDVVARAVAAPIRLLRGEPGLPPNQLVVALSSGLHPELGGVGTLRRVETTLDAALQAEVESHAKNATRRLAHQHVSAAAVVVLDNESGDVLAYVGSPDFFDREGLGQNDGVRALRQPGSALKPFVYAAAMSEIGLTAASLLPDLALSLPTEQGTFSPKNYDRREHGPVRVREALASSYNLPAAALANRLGVERALAALRRFGFSTLEQDAEHYGVALALGDGEVRLVDLARAYSALARGGLLCRERLARAVVDQRGVRREVPGCSPARVLDARVAALVTDILADPGARAPGFGLASALELPFPAAVKTGTSKGHRDNWAVGFTREVTVAVWVGNFDGAPMVRSSGVTGAGPLFHAAMSSAMRGRVPSPLVDRSGLIEVEVCTLSGERPGEHCEHRKRELFVPGSEPHGVCSMHERVFVDAETGGLAAPGCPGAEPRMVERYPAEYAAWARSAGRPIGPTVPSARCPSAVPERADEGAVSIEYPRDLTAFRLDPLLGRQEIVLEARAPALARVSYRVDGRELGRVPAPFRMPWVLEAGSHELEASVAGSPPVKVRFSVD